MKLFWGCWKVLRISNTVRNRDGDLWDQCDAGRIIWFMILRLRKKRNEMKMKVLVPWRQLDILNDTRIGALNSNLKILQNSNVEKLKLRGRNSQYSVFSRNTHIFEFEGVSFIK